MNSNRLYILHTWLEARGFEKEAQDLKDIILDTPRKFWAPKVEQAYKGTKQTIIDTPYDYWAPKVERGFEATQSVLIDAPYDYWSPRAQEAYETVERGFETAKDITIDTPVDYWSEEGVAGGVASAFYEIPMDTWKKIAILDLLGLIPGVGVAFDTTALLVVSNDLADVLRSFSSIPTKQELLDVPPDQTDSDGLSLEGEALSISNKIHCEYLARVLKIIRYGVLVLKGVFSVVTDALEIVGLATVVGGAVTVPANFLSELGVKIGAMIASSSITWSTIALNAKRHYDQTKAAYEELDGLLYETMTWTAVNEETGAPVQDYYSNSPVTSETTVMDMVKSIHSDKGTAGIDEVLDTYETVKEFHLASLITISEASDDLGWA